MKELLQVFNYIQKYHEDNFDVLYLTLEFLLFTQNKSQSNMFLSQKNKEKALEDFKAYLESLGLEPFGFHLDLNYKKILKSLHDFKIQALSLGEFIQAITMQKTILKLYEYATSLEVNALVCGILDVKKGESVYNPCCGLGSWLLQLNVYSKDCAFYGMDINPKAIRIVKALALLLEFKTCSLSIGDIFSEPFTTEFKFDKVFCHPPLLNHLNIKAPKESQLAPYSKTALEIPFIDYSLMRFKKKAVFIVRTALLNKGVGERLCEYLLDHGLLESIIELPDNIFPYKAESYSLFVISHANKRCLLLDVSSFYLKEGKYHKLINLEEILDLYFSKQNTQYSNFVEYEKIKGTNPRSYKEQSDAQILLGELLESAYRGVRIASRRDSDLVSCYDFGIKDFSMYGFSDTFCDSTLKTNSAQLKTLKIKPFDVLLSMRGVTPKVAIIGKEAENKIVLANAGILVLRFKDSKVAKALYFYFLSKAGREILKRFYLSHNERVSEKEIKTLELPKSFLDSLVTYNTNFKKLCEYGESIARDVESAKALLGF
ncbi:N-6 DNA methylase [Helicobacter turcicus]|uniref:site-specific DNA-methyltransferase (adenine-specific) n=1 Tax=Helicobacter turcicus TaxID=2867412 RepID=A0ABS7JKV6_9HELI|nr:N-6 DNA methylase [Helicobacter turcicus]MBX7490029.1 N-6 DNA methylase [Helicobacter turcicus]MBX7544888.1 N-6 DNA methylase [Helicobacter turcicus]